MNQSFDCQRSSCVTRQTSLSISAVPGIEPGGPSHAFGPFIHSHPLRSTAYRVPAESRLSVLADRSEFPSVTMIPASRP